MARLGQRAVTTVQVSAPGDVTKLEPRWRDLERRANAPVFRSWTWTGCLAAERFTDPVLVEATDSGRTVALALFNRVRNGLRQPDLLYLGASGDPTLDCPYIEDNGVLAEAGREAALTEACLAAVVRSHVVILPGVGDDVLLAARATAGGVWIDKVSESPFIDLGVVRGTGGDYLAGLSANTRQQVRRSDRYFAATGALDVRQARSVPEAHALLDRMADLHQAAWIARGQPGSFAAPFFRRFHRALIEVGVPRGQVALTEVASGAGTVGILYNLRDAAGIRAYQSGFAFVPADNRAKPGLTCHCAAIRAAVEAGEPRYDFLAGGDRYKRSLANGVGQQYWLEAGPAWAPRLVGRQVRAALRAAWPG